MPERAPGKLLRGLAFAAEHRPPEREQSLKLLPELEREAQSAEVREPLLAAEVRLVSAPSGRRTPATAATPVQRSGHRGRLIACCSMRYVLLPSAEVTSILANSPRWSRRGQRRKGAGAVTFGTRSSGYRENRHLTSDLRGLDESSVAAVVAASSLIWSSPRSDARFS